MALMSWRRPRLYLLTRTRKPVLLLPALTFCYLLFSSPPPFPHLDSLPYPSHIELKFNWTASSSRLSPGTPSFPEAESSKDLLDGLCQGNDCLKGRWVPREPAFKTLDDFQEVFARRGTSWMWNRCPVGDLPLSVFSKDPLDNATKADSVPEAEQARLEEQRIVDVFNWVWRPDKEKGVQVQWDAKDFVVRLLKRPGGIVFMGDSVSAGHEHSFASYLEEAGISFQMFFPPAHYWAPPSSETQGEASPPSIRSHILSPGHPVTLELQRRAGVPDSRMRRPVFSLVEEHLLVHEEEMRRLVGLHGGLPDFKWYLQVMKKAERWVEWLADVSDPLTGISNVKEPSSRTSGESTVGHSQYEQYFGSKEPKREKREEGVDWDTILVVNTGAHWSRGTMGGMIPETGTHEEQRREMTGLYRDMVNSVVNRLTGPSFANLTVFYRSTSPAHPSCHLHSSPYSSPQAALADTERERWLDILDQGAKAGDALDRRVRRRWDWDLFDVHNRVWKEVIEDLQHLAGEEDSRRTRRRMRSPSEKVARSKWRYVDFWEMTLQRPDAHARPGRDCLHWCLPAVYNEWSRHLYHLVWTETEAGSR